MTSTPPASITDKMEAAAESLFAEFSTEKAPEAAAPPAEAKPAEVPAVEAKTDEKAPEAPPAEATASTSEAPRFGKDYQDLLTKFGGDHDKAARAFWDANNRAAQLAKEVEELKAGKATETAAPPAKEPEPVVAPEIKRFDDTLRTLESDYSALDTKLKKANEERTAVQDKIEELVDIITNLDLDVDTDVAKRKELSKARAQYAKLSGDIDRIHADAQAIRKDHYNTTVLRDQEVRIRKFEEAREAEITERERSTQDVAIRTFATTFFAELNKASEDIPDELREAFMKFAKDQSHVRLNVSDLPTTDVPAFIKEAKDEYLSLIDRAHRTKSKEYASRKAQDAEVAAPSGDAAVAQSAKSSRFRSRSEVEEFMDANAP